MQLMKDGIERFETGAVEAIVGDARKVAESGLRRGASAVILADNHPMGTAEPSDYDEQIMTTITIP
jgi:DNA repair protein RadC